MAKKPPNLFDFWNELKRRKVVKAVFVYVAVAWAILEAADTIFPALGLPEWTVKFVLILLVIVFILVVVLTWIYDITPEGIKVTEDIDTERKKEVGKKSAKGNRSPAVKSSTESIVSESELQQKVSDLESQLQEARKLSLSKVLPLLIKKLAFPLLIIMVLVLFLIYKQNIMEMLGFGDAKREIARTHVRNALPYIELNDFEAANREIELALESDPGYSYAWSSLAVISVKQGDLNKAIVQTIKAVELDPSNGSAAYNLAFALEDKNDITQAVEWYSKAIKADSSLLPAYSALGRLYNKMNQPVDAIMILTLAKNKYADSDTIYLIYKNLGNSYFLQGLQDSALKYLELSYNLNSSEPETNLFLAKAYEAAGDLSRAIVQWQNYINLETDTAKIDAAVKHRKELAVRQLKEIIE